MRKDGSQYIEKMIEEFRTPSRDALVECLLAKQKPVWDSAIFFSTEQSKNFYSDIFQFWVRSFFCFWEDTSAASLLGNAINFVSCCEIPTEEFQRNYSALLHERIMDSSFMERQKFPQTYIEINNRSFSNAYSIIDRPNFKSSVAHSGGEYVSFFEIINPGDHFKVVKK